MVFDCVPINPSMIITQMFRMAYIFYKISPHFQSGIKFNTFSGEGIKYSINVLTIINCKHKAINVSLFR